jgi:predicted dehydrogenase
MAKVKIAFLGCGGFMGAHAGRIKANPDAELVALCDTKPEITDKFFKQHLADYKTPVGQFTDPAEMYAKVKPDAVLIATPHTLHFQHAVQAINAGCHVFLEKPMVTNSGDAHALAKLAKSSGKIVVVGYNTSCSVEMEYIRNAIRTKALGNLELVTGYISQDWMKFTKGLWRQEPSLSGGGQAYDSGAHLFNSLVWTVESDIDTVFAFVDNKGTKVDINSTTNIRFTNGVLATITIGGNCPGYGAGLDFIFDNGRIETDGWSAGWMKIWKGTQEIKYPTVTGVSQTPDDNFIDAVLGRAQAKTSPQNGIVQSELMDAIYESARTGLPAKPKRG